jgi:hypothetical protein
LPFAKSLFSFEKKNRIEMSTRSENSIQSEISPHPNPLPKGEGDYLGIISALT